MLVRPHVCWFQTSLLLLPCELCAMGMLATQRGFIIQIPVRWMDCSHHHLVFFGSFWD